MYKTQRFCVRSLHQDNTGPPLSLLLMLAVYKVPRPVFIAIGHAFPRSRSARSLAAAAAAVTSSRLSTPVYVPLIYRQIHTFPRDDANANTRLSLPHYYIRMQERIDIYARVLASARTSL